MDKDKEVIGDPQKELLKMILSHPVFTRQEILKNEKFSNLSEKQVDRLLNQYKKVKLIRMFGDKKGVYIVEKETYGMFDMMVLAYKLHDCVISLQSALSHHGYLKNSPSGVRAISKKTHGDVTFRTFSIHYRKIDDDKKRLLGAEFKHGILIATPEKAYIDLQYLTLKATKHPYTGNDIFLSLLDKSKIDYFLVKGNYPTTVRIAINNALKNAIK